MKCENCSKEHDGSYGSGRFCCQQCAMSWSTKFDNHKETKWGKCSVCGKEIEVNKRASPSQVKCEDCKSDNHPEKINKSKKICKVCGQEKPCIRPEICKKQQLFPTLAEYFGFDLSKKGTIDIYEEFDRVRNLLIEDYWDNELSVPEMVKKYNHKNTGTFHYLLLSLGIEKRNHSEAVTSAYKNGKIDGPCSYHYKYGWHTTWNGKQVFYRSSYELDYAQELDEQQIDYDMENLRILYWDSQLLKQRVAIPDFYLPKYGTIIEIKSDYTYNEQNMRDRVRSYKEHGYNVKVIIEKKEVDFS